LGGSFAIIGPVGILIGGELDLGGEAESRPRFLHGCFFRLRNVPLLRRPACPTLLSRKLFPTGHRPPALGSLPLPAGRKSECSAPPAACGTTSGKQGPQRRADRTRKTFPQGGNPVEEPGPTPPSRRGPAPASRSRMPPTGPMIRGRKHQGRSRRSPRTSEFGAEPAINRPRSEKALRWPCGIKDREEPAACATPRLGGGFAGKGRNPLRTKTNLPSRARPQVAAQEGARVAGRPRPRPAAPAPRRKRSAATLFPIAEKEAKQSGPSGREPHGASEGSDRKPRSGRPLLHPCTP